MKKPHLAVNLFGFILIAALLLLFNTSKSQSVAPLCTQKWHQGYPYNAYCPDNTNTPGIPRLVGCQGLAAAIVIKYHGPNVYPHGEASFHEFDAAMTPVYLNLNGKTYNFNMPDVLTSVTTDAPRFIADVSISVGTRTGGSGAGGCLVDSGCAVINGYRWGPSVYSALKDNWGFDSTTLKELYPDELPVAWLDSVYRSQLDLHQPFILCGGQHCWVVDGYDETGKYHFVWGNGGSGWYDIHNLGPGYGEWRQVLVGIRPANGAVGPTTPCSPSWQCLYSNGVKTGYEYDNCGNVRASASCSNTCISNWVCNTRTGIESDGCGNTRTSTTCKKKGRRINYEGIEIEEEEAHNVEYAIFLVGKTYNILGKEVTGELQSGMYIRNGKKIVIQ